MKELSINEKAKAYDEAIERAKKLYGNEIAEEIFHELKECDDERIKKNCIHFLELQKQHHAATFEIEECIAWLEKKCETYPILSNSSNTGKNEQKSADKIEPRFEVGDWVVFITSESVYQVEKKENYEYTLRHILGGSMCLPFSNEKLTREWTIKDAKDGDVLVDEYNNIGIFKKCEDTYWHSYIYLGCDGKLRGFSIGGIHKQTDTNPSIKEQRDALMKAMNDAGYEWDSEKKELKKEKLT